MKKKLKKIVVWSVVILLLIGTWMVYWNYYNTFSEGNRAGVLQKFSRKGNVFKTYEGELVMSSITTTSNTTLASEKFFFSVKDENIAKALSELEGKHVTVHYIEKRNHFSWDGETNYFVDSVEEIK